MTANEQERLKHKWQEQDNAEIDAAIGALLQHGGGRRYLWWLLQVGRVGTQPYSQHALNTAFACGELNVGQQILERITSVSPEGYVTMMKEQADERRNRTTELRDAADRRGSGRDSDADSDPYAD